MFDKLARRILLLVISNCWSRKFISRRGVVHSVKGSIALVSFPGGGVTITFLTTEILVYRPGHLVGIVLLNGIPMTP